MVYLCVCVCVCVCLLCLTLSQAVVVDRTMYISGQLGMDVASGQLVEGGVQAQAKQVKPTGTHHHHHHHQSHSKQQLIGHC